MTEAVLDIRPDHLKIVLDILARHVPDREVWAFGSRATWKTKDYSDLDLAIIGDEPLSLKLSAALSDDFAESDLPFKVDVVDWATTSESFREIIKRDRVVVREVGTTTWSEYKVEQIKADEANALATGPFGSAISSRHFRDHGVPVIRGSNLSSMVGARLVEADYVFVGPEKAAEFRRSTAHRGDIIFTCWGTVGQVGLIDHRAKYGQYVISNKQMKLTPNVALADSLFLYYLFSSPSYQDKIRAQAIGSSVPGFNLGQLRNMELLLPPVFEQKAIASFLGALDDKIDLNRRMNETLEAMARALFDDAEQHEDWEEQELSRVCDIFDGPHATPPLAKEGGVFLGISNLADGMLDLADTKHVAEVDFAHWTRRVTPREGDLVFSYETRLGQAALIPAGLRCCLGRRMGLLRLKVDWLDPAVFLRAYLAPGFQETIRQRTIPGSTVDRIPLKDMGAFPITLPSKTSAQRLNSQIKPLRKKVDVNQRESETLASLRDLLLPRLLSGQLRLKDAEKMVADAV